MMNVERPTSNVQLPTKDGAPIACLLLATFFWGCGFTWAKRAGEEVNLLSGAGPGAPLGPVWVLAIRFFAAGVLWLIVFPQSRRGWDRWLIGRSFALGSTLTL